MILYALYGAAIFFPCHPYMARLSLRVCFAAVCHLSFEIATSTWLRQESVIYTIVSLAWLNRQIEMACRGEKEVTCCVRGYHVYKDIWAAAIGEELVCGREPTNMADRYTVAVLKQETVIGHLPRKISLFL